MATKCEQGDNDKQKKGKQWLTAGNLYSLNISYACMDITNKNKWPLRIKMHHVNSPIGCFMLIHNPNSVNVNTYSDHVILVVENCTCALYVKLLYFHLARC